MLSAMALKLFCRLASPLDLRPVFRHDPWVMTYDGAVGVEGGCLTGSHK